MTKLGKKWEYAMYKGDDLLCMGTKDEICKEMNISSKTFNFYRTSYYKYNRLSPRFENNRRRIIIRVDGKDKIWYE